MRQSRVNHHAIPMKFAKVSSPSILCEATRAERLVTPRLDGVRRVDSDAVMPSCLSSVVLLASIAFATGCATERAAPLFSAMSVQSWQALGAPARFELVEDDAGRAVLVGRGPISSNGFLASPRVLGDFRLAVDVKLGSADNPLGDKMNSGIQIRSGEKDGTVAGLQIEVDPSKRSWSGGVYDERGRAWLAPLDGTDAAGEAARAAFRRGEWNRYEIECIGPRIRTRVNGVPCAEWYDGIVSGLLAFQVHGGPPCEVAFRDARLEELGSHSWRRLDGGASASSGERCAFAAALAPAMRGVRMRVSGAGRVSLAAGDGATVVDVSFTADPKRPERVVELVWIDGAGAALIDGARAAAFAVPRAPASVRVLGAACEVRDGAFLLRD